MAGERRAIHAYLSADARTTWQTAADEAGVSVSGLFEALAEDMRAHPPASGGHPRWPEVVAAARRIDAQRRRRSRD